MSSKTFLKKIKEKLLQEKQEIEGRAKHRPDIDTDGDETDEIQGNMLIEMQNHLNTRDKTKLSQINEALNKIEESKYGACNDCEEDISEKRLLANPYFTLCVSCAEERELERKRKGL